MNQIKLFLQQLNLTETEIEIYLTLLKTDPLSITQLSKFTNNPRTTTHENTEKLIQKGLIVKTIKGNIKKIQAEPPSKLKLLLESQKIHHEAKLLNLNKIEENLPSFIKSIYDQQETNNNTDINAKIIEGKKNVFEKIYQDTFKATTVYSFSNIEKYYNVYPGTRPLWIQSYKENPKRIFWDITIDSTATNTNVVYDCPEANQYRYKLIPEKNIFSSSTFTDYMIYEDKIALIQLDPNNVQGILIYSKILYEGFKILHQTMWGFLPKPKTR